MEEVRKLSQEKAELEKKNDFLKKYRRSLQRKSIRGMSFY